MTGVQPRGELGPAEIEVLLTELKVYLDKYLAGASRRATYLPTAE